ncbi:MAG TPA: trifunctional glycosyltransferase/class I SAM-dependent methyltransferase/polysaccharide deacetylase [Azospirillum sp.]|nr:trifunctional glycosyltransferase/class I SAM-dependent methyltransferase/polysaccharide deacetylase [Azospirillum sp.]
MHRTQARPDISVIVPAFNAAPTVRAALASLSAQTKRDWEAIVVDDGSRDDTAGVVAALAAADPRIRLVRQANGGVSAARNRGIAEARADWLHFLDADDWIAPACLQRLARARHAPSRPDFIHCGWKRYLSEQPGPDEYGPDQTDLFPAIARHCPFPVHAGLVRKALVDAAGGFDTTLVACEDWDLWQRIARTGARFQAVRAVLAFYRFRGDSASTVAERFLTDGLEVIRRIHRADPRVTNPLPRYADGAPAADMGLTSYHFTTWLAGYAIGQGREGAPMLKHLEGVREPTLSPDAVAWVLRQAVPIGRGRLVEDWKALWPTVEPPVLRFLEALEVVSGVADLAARGQRRLEAYLLDTCAAARPARIGRTLQVPLDPARPIGDVAVPEGVERVRCAVVEGGEPVGIIEVAAGGPVLAGSTLAKAYAWEFAEVVKGHLRRRRLRSGVKLLRWLLRPHRIRRFGRCLQAEWEGREGARAALRTALVQSLSGAGTAEAAARFAALSQGGDERPPAAGTEAEWEEAFTEADPWHYDSSYEQGKYERTLGMLPDGPIGHALELACAEGHFTVKLAPRVGRLIAADISATALGRARERCAGLTNVTFQHLDMVTDPIPGGMDLIVCSEVLYYLRDRRALRQVAGKFAQALKPGGRLVMAHANLMADEPHRTGFPWPHAFGSKAVGDVFAAEPGLCLEREIHTPLYRVHAFRRLEPGAVASAPEFREMPLPDDLPPFVASQVRWRLPGCVAARSGVTGRVPILMYHRIADDGPEALRRYRVSPAMFDAQLALLRREGFHTIGLDEWHWHLMMRRPLSGRPVLITFDDGYRDIAEHAAPTLRRHGMVATVFIVTDAVGTTAAWDGVYGEPAPLLSWPEIRGLCGQGIAFAAHGASHRALTGLSAAELLEDGRRARRAFAAELQTPVTALAYPYGDEDGAVRVAMRECGYDCGFTVQHGTASVWGDSMRLPRIEVSGLDDLEAFAAKLGVSGAVPAGRGAGAAAAEA